MKVIIIGSILVIALLTFGCLQTAAGGLAAVGTTTQIMGQNSGINETSAKATWKSTVPFGIIDWSRTGNTLTIALQNNSPEALDLVSISLANGSINSEASNGITPGAKIVKSITMTDQCNAGSKYSVPKSTIVITYNTKSMSNQQEVGNADILGTC